MAESLTKAGRYQILEELGRGSMGVVYKGYDPVIGRTVAIKTMRIEGLADGFEEFASRFKSEARAAGILSHPNIVTIYDFGEDNGLLYLAMEVLSGKSLQEVMKEEHVLPVGRVLSIYEQVSRALDHAHRRNVVHRDIKPANIMILVDGTVKVADFGIAKVLGSATGMTHTGLIVGTPNYMSPEQVRGQTVDGRSDIFALGVILYEALTGQKPFAGQNITTVIYKIINENPSPPSLEAGPILHPGLWQVISKALAKRPEDRYQSCADLFQDLKNYQSLGESQPLTATMVLPQAVPPARSQPLPETPPLPPVPASSRPLERPAAAGAPGRAAPQVAPAQATLPAKRSFLLPVVGIVLAVALLSFGGYFFLYHRTLAPAPTTALPSSAPASSPPNAAETPASGRNAAAGQAPSAAATAGATSPASEQQTSGAAPTPSLSQPAAPVTATSPSSSEATPESLPKAHAAGSVPKESLGKASETTPQTEPGRPRHAEQVTPAKKNPAVPTQTSPPVRAQNAPPSEPVQPPPSSTVSAPVTPVSTVSTPVQHPAPTTQTPSPADNTSQFLLETEPIGLEAVIDGKSYGKTPVVARLVLGQHTLVLKSLGVEVLRRTFQQGVDDQYKKWVLPITKPVS